MIVFSIWTKHTGGGGERSKWCNGCTAAYDSGIAGAAFLVMLMLHVQGNKKESCSFFASASNYTSSYNFRYDTCQQEFTYI